MTKVTANAKLQGYLALAYRRRVDDGSVGTCVRRMIILVDLRLLIIDSTCIVYLTLVCSTSDVCVCVYVCLIWRISGKKLTQNSKDDDDIYLHCAQSTRHPMKNIIVPCTRLLPLILVICYLTNSVLVECKVPVGNSWTPNVADTDDKSINSKSWKIL